MTELVRTRLAWHALAEWVLAPARQAIDGHIGLAATPGGFGSRDAGLQVEGDELVVGRTWAGAEDAAGRRLERRSITTLADAAAAAGVPPGRSTGVYETATRWDPDAPLAIDLDAARVLADWFALGTTALGLLGADDVTLWPEHFDVATTIEARVNLGASPGDAEHPEPYLYVGPWEHHEGAFWNEPFGASLDRAEVDSVDRAVAFFREGIDRL